MTWEGLEDLFSPRVENQKMYRSIVQFIQINCKERTIKVTAFKFYSGQMATGESWVKETSGKILNPNIGKVIRPDTPLFITATVPEEAYQRYCVNSPPQ